MLINVMLIKKHVLQDWAFIALCSRLNVYQLHTDVANRNQSILSEVQNFREFLLLYIFCNIFKLQSNSSLTSINSISGWNRVEPPRIYVRYVGSPVVYQSNLFKLQMWPRFGSFNQCEHKKCVEFVICFSLQDFEYFYIYTKVKSEQ